MRFARFQLQPDSDVTRTIEAACRAAGIANGSIICRGRHPAHPASRGDAQPAFTERNFLSRGGGGERRTTRNGMRN